MKPKVFALALVLGLLACSSSRANIVLNFGPIPGADLFFDGSGHFQFRSANQATGGALSDTNDFQITSESNGNFSGLGLEGTILPTYTIGTITTQGTKETAGVTPTGTITIYDKNGVALTASVDWIQISTDAAIGGLNSEADINLKNVTYTGTNSDLKTLRDQSVNGGIAVVSFQFTASQDLKYLSSHQTATSYSGSLTAVPAPPTVALFGVGALAFGAVRLVRRRRPAPEAL